MCCMRVLQDGDLRLRPAQLPADIALAVPWYQDPEVLYYSEGPGVAPYDIAIVARMYAYLARHGELYLIEVQTDHGWQPIGDATLMPESMPLVIGEQSYRSRGVGKRVLRLLIERARSLGWSRLQVARVFTYNVRSRRLFEALGFTLCGTKVEDTGQNVWQFELSLKPDQATSSSSPESPLPSAARAGNRPADRRPRPARSG